MALFPDRFVQGIQEDNPWWQSGEFTQAISSFKRSDYSHYVEELGEHKVNVVIGPRRIGKTTLMFQLIEHLLKEKKVNPKSILFASLERPYFELLPRKLDGALEFFEEKIFGTPVAASKETMYLFIDEAQYDPSWPRIMKQYVDQKRQVHAMVSGSSATAVYQDAESGTGRFHTRQMVAMKLRDVLRFRHPELAGEITRVSFELRDALVRSCAAKGPAEYEKAVNKTVQHSGIRALAVRGMEEYLLKGGYPEFYQEKDWKKISAYYQQNVFDTILQKDVVNTFKIRFPEKIRGLLVVLVQNTAQLLARNKLAEALGLKNIRTVDQYVDALTEAFLIRASARFKQSGYPSTKEKKFYAADTGLRNAVLGVEETMLASQERGQLLETAVFNHSLRLGFHMDQQVRRQGYYWLDGESERDMIMDIRKKFGFVLPVEVKNGQCGPEDIKKTRLTMAKLKSPFGLVVCKDQTGRDGNVLVVPAWIFLLSC